MLSSYRVELCYHFVESTPKETHIVLFRRENNFQKLKNSHTKTAFFQSRTLHGQINQFFSAFTTTLLKALHVKFYNVPFI